MSKRKGSRFIDNEVVKQKLAELHMIQLEILLERLEDGLIEAQEMKLIWEMVKHHGIGVDTVEDKVREAIEAREGSIADLDIEEEWVDVPEA